jgi:hypothetical protein
MISTKVWTTSLIPLMQFQWNFTELICRSSPTHIARVFWLNDFWPSYGPLIKRCFSLCVARYTKACRTTPHKLLVQFYQNFTGMISTKSSCALSVCLSVCHKTCPNMKLAIMRRHMWSLIALVNLEILASVLCKVKYLNYCLKYSIEKFTILFYSNNVHQFAKLHNSVCNICRIMPLWNLENLVKGLKNYKRYLLETLNM